MYDHKGFANALLIMLNNDWEGVAQGNEDSFRSSIDNTPSKEIRSEKKKLSISNFITKDLMKIIDEGTPCKEEYDNKFNYSHNYSTDASEDKIPRHIRKGWVCEFCMNFNYESIII
jgi:hypothetical protein